MKKNFISFFWLVVYAVGLIGGVGYAAYNGEWFIAVCVILLGVMAFPKFKDAWNGVSA